MKQTFLTCVITFIICELFATIWLHQQVPKSWMHVDRVVGWANYKDTIYYPNAASKLEEGGYILCLGDSGTFGINKKVEDCVSYCKFLSKEMNMPVYDAGVCGYDTKNICRLLQTWKLPKPAIVCVRSLANDLRYKNWFSNRDAQISFLDTFAVYSFYKALGKKALPRVGPEDYYNNLTYISNYFKDTRVLIIEYPLECIDMGDDTVITPDLIKCYTEISKKVKAEFVNVPKTANFFNNLDKVHPSKEGAKQTAEAICSVLRNY